MEPTLAKTLGNNTLGGYNSTERDAQRTTLHFHQESAGRHHTGQELTQATQQSQARHHPVPYPAQMSIRTRHWTACENQRNARFTYNLSPYTLEPRQNLQNQRQNTSKTSQVLGGGRTTTFTHKKASFSPTTKQRNAVDMSGVLLSHATSVSCLKREPKCKTK